MPKWNGSQNSNIEQQKRANWERPALNVESLKTAPTGEEEEEEEEHSDGDSALLMNRECVKPRNMSRPENPLSDAAS